MPLVAAFLESFINPGLLLGLALVAAPIIIHILNRRHYTVVEWAAMDFLLQADSRTRRRLRLEDLILLLLRVLVIALLVLAVARPLLRGFSAAREAERIVVLDDSFSMEASGGTGSAFSQAREAAARQVEDAVGKSIPVSVWSGSRPELGSQDLLLGPAAGEGASSSDSSAASAQATGAQAAGLLADLRGREATDLSLRLPALASRLAERLEARKEAGLRSLVLVSDLRARDWLEPGGGALRGDIAVLAADLKKRGLLESLRWRFVDTGSSDRENCAVTAIRLGTEHPLAKVPVKISVEVTNLGSRDRKHVTGELEVAIADPGAGKPGYRVIHRIPLPAIDEVPAGKARSFEVEFTFEAAGKHPLLARIEADRLPRDDAAHAVVEVREGLRALVVDGDPGPGRFSGESGFLLSAVAPRGTVPSGILPRRVTSEVAAKDLRGVDVVLILNRQGLEAGERSVLEELLRRGGGVAFFLGNRVEPERYGEIPFFPARLRGVKGGPGRARLKIGQQAHAAFDVFRGIEGSSLGQVGFDRFFALEPSPGATVAATFTDPDGTAAIIDSAQAKGRAAVFNLTADRDWNDWPTDPSYPVVLQEWVRYLAPRRMKASAVVAGEILLWEPAAGVRYTVVTPDGASAPADAVKPFSPGGGASGAGAGPSDGAASRGALVFAGTFRAGFYRVEPASTVAGSEVSEEALETAWYACRRHPAESDLEPAGEERLRAALGAAGIELVLGRDSGGEPFQKAEEGETWRLFALGAGLLLLVELLCAWWFGRR
ncbi:MAG: BatA domain-containing protein [Planctomycetes bacterium]|nr:BatA domain-containing protein [Planctomycetota bacterium]